MKNNSPILQTDFPERKLFWRGKVRDTWEIPELPPEKTKDRLLMITTDRLSAFDVVMPQGVPELGKLRNQISLFWFEYFKHAFPNHILSSDQLYCQAFVPGHSEYDLLGRCALVHRAEVFRVECIVRGHLSGSAWKSYRESGTICGLKYPAGLQESDHLPYPIFTPSTKSDTGHDENIDFDTMVNLLGSHLAELLRSVSLQIYTKAAAYALECGIIIADTKFEFGIRRNDGRTVLVDELLTPDSSRFWPLDEYNPGGPQPSFDKQFVRDYLESIKWNKQPPASNLPESVIEGTRQRYIQAYQMLTGMTWCSERFE